jgi:hypothetical protein
VEDGGCVAVSAAAGASVSMLGCDAISAGALQAETVIAARINTVDEMRVLFIFTPINSKEERQFNYKSSQKLRCVIASE